MPKPTIPTRCAALPALLFALLLTACGEDRPKVGAPPIERAAPVVWPVVPIGEATCPDEETGAAVPCLSDRESAELIAGLADALDIANGRLLWLRDWLAEYDEAMGE